MQASKKQNVEQISDQIGKIDIGDKQRSQKQTSS
jgi:hypothetical protein